MAGLILSVLLASCIALPFPHDAKRTPLVAGTIVDAKTGQPIQGGAITLEPYGATGDEGVHVLTDQAGHFEAQVVTRSWWVVLWLGSFDPFCEYRLIVEHAAYRTVDTGSGSLGDCPESQTRLVRMDKKAPESRR
ncbi:MAG: hypothetical protein ACKOCD_11600 [Nitrospiraceae bacterium]